MISRDIRFEGFDAPSWTRLVSLFLPGLRDRGPEDRFSLTDLTSSQSHSGPAERAGTLTVVEDAHRQILCALHSLRGPVDALTGTHTGDLAALAEAHHAARILVLRAGTMEELSERMGLSVRVDEEFLAQSLSFLGAVRSGLDAGHIQLWPNPVGTLPVPPPGAVTRALDIFLPSGKALVVMLYENNTSPAELATAAVLRRNEHGKIDWIAGPDQVRGWTGVLGGDWRRDYRVVVDAVGRNVAPVHMALFTEMDTLHALLEGGDAGAWARQSAVRNLIISPMPRPIALAMGADAIRGVGRLSAQALGGFGFAGKLLPMAQQLRARLLEARTVTDELGFDPLRVLAAILRREDQGEGNPRGDNGEEFGET